MRVGCLTRMLLTVDVLLEAATAVNDEIATHIDCLQEHELSPVRHFGLSQSPEAHQNFAGSTPELCSGVHQKGCDLEGVEGATPPNIYSLKP